MALAFPETFPTYESELFPSLFDVDLDLENQVWPMGNTSLTPFGDVFDTKDDMFSFGAPPTKAKGKRAAGGLDKNQKVKGLHNKRRKGNNSKASPMVDINVYPGLSDNLNVAKARAAALANEPIYYDADASYTQLLQDDFKELSSLWIPESSVVKPKPAHLKKRSSTGSKAKPKRSYKSRKPQPRTLSLVRTKQILDEIDNRKRLKWSDDENLKLWRGISVHGNNWTEVKKEVTTRSYDQIKDKGRRLLFVEGWKTGRKKKSSDEAMDYARNIALRVLKTLKAKKAQL